MEKEHVLTLEERRTIQLGMLEEFDAVCRKNGLKYSLAYGTLLGAIRHKGFIPWDDDVDVMMPLDDVIRLKEVLNSDNIQYVDPDTDPSYVLYFPRVAHKKTYHKPGLRIKSYGVCFDLYPIIPITEDESEIMSFLKKGGRLSYILGEFAKWRSRIVRRIPIADVPFFHKYVCLVRDYVYSKARVGTCNFFSSGGTFKKKACFTFDLFASLIEVDFEGYKFLAIGEYDKYLTQYYGDYMKYPPVEERFLHGGIYYWEK